ncbi:MAG: hypothetical protein ABI177_09645 [Edaphobacter sp.]
MTIGHSGLHILALLALLVSASFASHAQVASGSAKTYGQHLVEEALARHPNVIGLDLYTINSISNDSASLASAGGHVGQKATEQELTVMQSGAARIHDVNGHLHVVVPLQDVVRNMIGVLDIAFADRRSDQAKAKKEALGIGDELRGRTIELTNLSDPFPYDPGFSPNTYGQHLVDLELQQHPDILVLAMHGKLPGRPESAILASSFGRIGKRDDDGDLKAVRTGRPNLAIVKAGNRYNIGLPLMDVVGNTIGLLTIAFPYKAGDDPANLLRRAEQIRNELGRRILKIGNIVEPFPYNSRFAGHYYAQDLIEETLAQYPHLIGLSMRVTPPGSADNVIIASSFGRIGMMSDESDLLLIQSGQHNMKVWPSGDRYSGQVMLHDVSGKTIGSLLVVFPYMPGSATGPLLAEAEAVRDGLAARIASAEQLTSPGQPHDGLDEFSSSFRCVGP